MKAVIFTVNSLHKLSQFSISNEWFENFSLPKETLDLKRVQIGEIIYLIESNLENDDMPIIVINLDGDNSIFNNEPLNTSVLERIITVAHSIYSNSVVIPTNWRQHREHNLISIQSPSRDKSCWRKRLHFNMRPRDSHDLFVFSKTEDIVNFDNLDLQMGIYDLARQTFEDAILTKPSNSPIETMAGITLSERLPQGFTQGASLDQWYQSRLTAEQRSFVDKPHDGPVRLRGAAGTGKTLSLVIKFIRDAISARNMGKSFKLGFLVHSFASVDLVSAIAESLDATGILQNKDKNSILEIRTLYDLAYDHLRFNLDDLTPLSLDGREGRRMQYELIESVLKDMASSKILRLQFEELTPSIMTSWDLVSASQNKRFVAEVMNEFASVLDAEGIRVGEDRGERYAKGVGARPSWLMALPSEIDRRFILEIHRRYRTHLANMNTLSVDQMIGDFNSFLDSNRWDLVRGRAGYDAIFVDELHLFTSIERQSLHKLIKRNIESDGRPKRPPIFMAYDLKQSPRDTFIEYGEADHNLFGSSTKLQNSELVKLEKVFRYTPQIAEFLADLDATFPAIDIPGEWEAYSGEAELDDGETPELFLFKDDKTLFTTIFEMADRTAKTVKGGGRRVAVLCVSEEQFDVYVKIAEGRYANRHIAITDREPSSELRHIGKRFILSMPEYVAGLQFDTVFLIHVDAQEAPIDAGDGVRRRFISNIYLGSSRAERTLKICSCTTRGGMSDVLQMALDRRSLKHVSTPPPVAGVKK